MVLGAQAVDLDEEEQHHDNDNVDDDDNDDDDDPLRRMILPNNNNNNDNNNNNNIIIPPPSTTPKVSSLDFERIVNDYSIQATRDRYGLDICRSNSNNSSSSSSIMMDQEDEHGHGDDDGDGDDDEKDQSSSSSLLLIKKKKTKNHHHHHRPTASGDYGTLPPASNNTASNNTANNDSKDTDDDDNNNNKIHHHHHHHHHHTIHKKTTTKQQHRRRSTTRTATRWILSALVGLVTGLTTIFIVHITSAIVHWRIRTLDTMLCQENSASDSIFIFVAFAIWNLCLATSACGLCIYVAPEGTGSGIPEVKAYLNGVRVKKFTSWRLFGVKIVGTILSVSSSLAVGMEGPLIHIGAIVGASFTKSSSVLSKLLSATTSSTTTSTTASTTASTATSTSPSSSRRTRRRCKPTCQSSCCCPVPTNITASSSLSLWAQSLWTFTTTNLAHFSIDAERRDLISIGASVGFAASFGAPIGGLLFILDDISSYFSKNMFLRTLVANAIGTFCLAVQSGNLSNYSVINLGSYKGSGQQDDIFLERFEIVPLFLVVAVAGGTLGGTFCASFEYLKVHVMDRLTTPKAKLTQVAVVSIITSALTFGLPYVAWACNDIDIDPDDDTSSDKRGQQFFCQDGQVNEMATMMFGSRDTAIKRILSDPTQFQERTLWAIGILFYALMTLTYGSFLPSGIFTPTVLIGASLGGAAGLRFQEWFGQDIPASTFALLGVAAMLAGIQRSTVSISVILVEGTGQIKVLLPVVIVVLVSRYVASKLHPNGLYETSMKLKQYPYMDHEQKVGYDVLQVHQIMSSPAKVLYPLTQASHLVHMLQTTSHNGFPVIDPQTKKLLGLVRRDQIVALLECGVFEEEVSDEEEAMMMTTTTTDSMMMVDGGGVGTAAAGVVEASTRSAISDVSSPGRITSSHARPGIASSPLVHWAYHIKDDRYDYLKNAKAVTRRRTRRRSSIVISAAAAAAAVKDHEDEFDQHEMLRNIRNTIRSMPPRTATIDGDGGAGRGGGGGGNNNQDNATPFGGYDCFPPVNDVLMLQQEQERRRLVKQEDEEDDDEEEGEESASSPPPPPSTQSTTNHHRTISSSVASTTSNSMMSNNTMEAPKGFAEIGVNEYGNLFVTWLHPECRHLYVNIAAVMNRGTYCVPEHLPVSKARYLFTQLGLRHVVVLGGPSGGEVVGVFTRANLLEGFIKERVGFNLYSSY